MLGEFGDCLILKRRSKIDYGNRNLHVHEDKCMNGTCVCVYVRDNLVSSVIRRYGS